MEKATLPSGSYLLVDVPEYSYDHTVDVDEDITWLMMFEPAKGFENDPSKAIKLPPGSYELIGLGSDISKQDWERIVDKHDTDQLMWKDYQNFEKGHLHSRYSGFSWLKSLNKQPEVTVILKMK